MCVFIIKEIKFNQNKIKEQHNSINELFKWNKSKIKNTVNYRLYISCSVEKTDTHYEEK